MRGSIYELSDAVVMDLHARACDNGLRATEAALSRELERRGYMVAADRQRAA
jgi:hypothetical protein